MMLKSRLLYVLLLISLTCCYNKGTFDSPASSSKYAENSIVSYSSESVFLEKSIIGVYELKEYNLPIKPTFVYKLFTLDYRHDQKVYVNYEYENDRSDTVESGAAIYSYSLDKSDNRITHELVSGDQLSGISFSGRRISWFYSSDTNAISYQERIVTTIISEDGSSKYTYDFINTAKFVLKETASQ